MSPRLEEEFADFELVNDGAFDYGRKTTSVKPTKSCVAETPSQSVAVQSTPIANDMDKINDAIAELQAKVMDTSAETASQFQKVQTVVDEFGEQRVTQDRRMRTLENCFDDYEMDLKKCTNSIGLLKNQFETLQCASMVADLRQTTKENVARSIESSSRLDFMVEYHLPSIEQNIKAIHIKQRERDSVSLELRRTINNLKIQLGDLTENHVAEILVIAENAELRSQDVQIGFSHFMKNVIPVLEDKVHELAYTAAQAFKDSAAAIVAISDQVNALQLDQANYRDAIATDIENLATVDSQLIDETFECKDRLNDVEEAIKTLISDGNAMSVDLEKMAKVVTSIDENEDIKHRVSRAEEVIQHLVGKVVPLLENRIQEHQELVQISEKTAATEKAKSAEREALLFKRIEELEGKTSQVDMACMQNLQLNMRANSLERTLNDLVGEVRQFRLQERKVQLHPSIASALAQTGASTPAEIQEDIEELIEEVIEVANDEVTEVKVQCSDNVAPPMPPRSGSHLNIQCRTLLGEAITVSIPPFVSIRYLKQMIFFKTGCTMHPTTQSLVYAGKVLQDGWRVGGGMFAASLGQSNEEGAASEEFGGIKDGSTVLIVVTKKFLE